MEKDNTVDVLKDLGLSEQEINVYITLLKKGGSSATTLAQETGLKRTTVYPILERLIAQGVVVPFEQGSKKFFNPIRPNKLATHFERKLKSFIDIIPTLEKLDKGQTEAFGVRFIQSKKELKSFYDDILEQYKGKNYYVIGSTKTWLDIDREFFADWRRKRAVNNIHVKLLLTDDSRAEEGQNDHSLLREFKYLAAKYKFKSTIDIYDDKIIIVGPEVKALAVVIAIPPMVDVFRAIFEALWENLPVA